MIHMDIIAKHRIAVYRGTILVGDTIVSSFDVVSNHALPFWLDEIHPHVGNEEDKNEYNQFFHLYELIFGEGQQYYEQDHYDYRDRIENLQIFLIHRNNSKLITQKSKLQFKLKNIILILNF